MKTFQFYLICIFAALLAGCQTSYGPDGDYGGFPHGGYTDTRINSNTSIISFDGNVFTSPQEVETYVLYRAARVTMENGYNYFIITSTSTSPININVQTQVHYHDYITNPPTLHRTYYTSETYQSYSTSRTSLQLFYRKLCDKSDLHSATVVIKMFSGNIPPGLPNAYTATDIIAHLSPT